MICLTEQKVILTNLWHYVGPTTYKILIYLILKTLKAK